MKMELYQDVPELVWPNHSMIALAMATITCVNPGGVCVAHAVPWAVVSFPSVVAARTMLNVSKGPALVVTEPTAEYASLWFLRVKRAPMMIDACLVIVTADFAAKISKPLMVINVTRMRVVTVDGVKTGLYLDAVEFVEPN